MVISIEYVPRIGQPLFVFGRIDTDGVEICGEKDCRTMIAVRWDRIPKGLKIR